MDTLTAWSLAGIAAAAVGCATVYAWDRWRTHRSPATPQGEVVTAPAEAATSPVPSTDAPAPRPAARHEQVVVDVDDRHSFVLVLGDENPVTPGDLFAVRQFLTRTYGPPMGLHIFAKVLDAYTAHVARDLDTELASLGGNS